MEEHRAGAVSNPGKWAQSVSAEISAGLRHGRYIVIAPSRRLAGNGRRGDGRRIRHRGMGASPIVAGESSRNRKR